LEPEERAGSSAEDAVEPASFTRRRFLKVVAGAGVVTGVLGLGALSGLGIVYRPPEPPPPWEIAPGVVDYSKVPEGVLGGPTPNILKVAQWYDYWPGSFKTDFQNYMAAKGYTVSVQQDTFTSNEELFEWITLGGKKYDVIFPTNHIVDNIKKSALIYNLNLAWIPNFSNLWSDFVRVPHHVDSPDNLDQRQDPNGLNYVSVPYFWGTTGIAWRKDQIPKDEVESIGLDFFTMASYSPQAAGYPTTGHPRRQDADARGPPGCLHLRIQEGGMDGAASAGADPVPLRRIIHRRDGQSLARNPVDVERDSTGAGERNGRLALSGEAPPF